MLTRLQWLGKTQVNEVFPINEIVYNVYRAFPPRHLHISPKQCEENLHVKVFLNSFCLQKPFVSTVSLRRHPEEPT